MGTLARLITLLIPCLALLAPTPGADAGDRRAACRLLDSQAAYMSGGGLSLLGRFFDLEGALDWQGLIRTEYAHMFCSTRPGCHRAVNPSGPPLGRSVGC